MQLPWQRELCTYYKVIGDRMGEREGEEREMERYRFTKR